MWCALPHKFLTRYSSLSYLETTRSELQFYISSAYLRKLAIDMMTGSEWNNFDQEWSTHARHFLKLCVSPLGCCLSIACLDSRASAFLKLCIPRFRLLQ